MGVGRDGDLEPHLLGHLAVGIVEIEPARMGVELEIAAALERRPHDRLEIDAVGAAFVDQPAARMGQDVEIAVVHGPDHPLGLPVEGEIEGVVNRADREVEPLQDRIGQIERAVVEDVDLARLEDADAAKAVVEGVDFVDLAGQPIRVQAAGHGGALRVVGDGEVVVAPLLGGQRHFPDREFAVGGGGVGVKVALDPRQGDELGERALGGGLDLALVLAQLGRDPRQAELVVDLLLGAAGDPLVPLEETIFVELPTAFHGPFTQADIVGLGAGEVVERGAIARPRHHPQIDLRAGAEDHGGARRSLRDDALHLLIGDEAVDDARAALGGHQDVEVADRLLAAPVAAGDGDVANALLRLQIGGEGLGDLLGVEQAGATLDRAGALELGEDLGLGLGAEARELPQLARARRLGELFRRLDLELLEDGLHPLGSQARYRGDVGKRLGRAAGDLVQQLEMAGLDQLGDLAGQILADARQLAQILSRRDHGGGGARKVLDRPRGVAVGAHAERVGALDLQQIRQTVEGRGDLGVVKGHSRAPSGERASLKDLAFQQEGDLGVDPVFHDFTVLDGGLDVLQIDGFDAAHRLAGDIDGRLRRVFPTLVGLRQNFDDLEHGHDCQSFP